MTPRRPLGAAATATARAVYVAWPTSTGRGCRGAARRTNVACGGARGMRGPRGRLGAPARPAYIPRGAPAAPRGAPGRCEDQLRYIVLKCRHCDALCSFLASGRLSSVHSRQFQSCPFADKTWAFFLHVVHLFEPPNGHPAASVQLSGETCSLQSFQGSKHEAHIQPSAPTVR